MNEKPNILFIVIDALRARNLGCYGYSQDTSPNINKLAKNGVVFEDAYSCSNATDPSLTTIFSGKYPTNHGIINHGFKVTREEIQRFNKNRIKLLPEILKEHNYTTLAVDWLGRWHRRGYDFYSGLSKRNRLIDFALRVGKLGLEFKRGQFHFNYIKRLFDDAPWGLRRIEEAEYIGDKVIDLIKRNSNRNFFLHLHFWDTHAYHFKGRNKDERTKEYDEAIRAVDYEIGRIIEKLEDYNIFNKTLIILTADHGESLMEHGIYHTHLGLYDETIHVPLILRFSNLPEGKMVKGFVQHYDLVPTILDILKIPDTGGVEYYDGTSLCPLIEGKLEKIRKEICVEDANWKGERRRKKTIRTSKYKYIFNEPSPRAINRHYSGTEELYDLQADPRETINIIKENPTIAHQLRKRYYHRIKQFHQDKNAIEKRRIRERIMVLISNEKI